MWLRAMGGRNASDVNIDEESKKYVLMGDGKWNDVRVYIPDEKEIKKILRK